MKYPKIEKKALRRILTVKGIITKRISKYHIKYKIFVWPICHIVLPFISHKKWQTKCYQPWSLDPRIIYQRELTSGQPTSVSLYQRGAYAKLLMTFYQAMAMGHNKY